MGDLQIPTHPTYAQIRELELRLAEQNCPMPEPEHYFADGVYGRVMHLKADDVVTGKMHRFSTLNILLSGKLRITTDRGVQDVEAPAIFVTEPGTKKVCYAYTDASFMNVHPTKLKDVSAIEQKFIIPEPPIMIEKGES